jgi:large subunit ribosomal protein L28
MTCKVLIFMIFFISNSNERGYYGMSRVCAVSGKKALSGNKRSHSLQASRRKWNVNLQKVKVVVDGKPQRIRISARALKTLKAQQA